MSVRDVHATCPRCAVALDEWGDRAACARCKGALVTEARVSQMIADLLGDQVSVQGWAGKIAEPEPLPLESRGGPDVITCPRCLATMEAVWLHTIAVDRCVAHGLWFDTDELQDVLERGQAAGKLGATPGEKIFATTVLAVTLAAELLRLLVG